MPPSTPMRWRTWRKSPRRCSRPAPRAATRCRRSGENPEDFQAKLAAFREAAGAMRDAAASGEPMQVGMALRDVGQACKGCHDDYRAE